MTDNGLPLAVMPDSMIYDLIVEESGMTEALEQLSKDGTLELLSTRIQESQLAAVRDSAKSEGFRRIPRRQISPGVFVLGYSLLGVDRLGDGTVYDHVRGTEAGRKHVLDGMIAETAHTDGLILVTHDRRLVKRGTDAGVAVINFPAFRLLVRAMLQSSQPSD